MKRFNLLDLVTFFLIFAVISVLFVVSIRPLTRNSFYADISFTFEHDVENIQRYIKNGDLIYVDDAAVALTVSSVKTEGGYITLTGRATVSMENNITRLGELVLKIDKYYSLKSKRISIDAVCASVEIIKEKETESHESE